MSECEVPTKKSLNFLTVAAIIIVVAFAIIGAVVAPLSHQFLPGLELIVDTLLITTTNIIYIVGGGILIFGVILVMARFLQCKIREPYKASCVTRYLSGYLTLSLEFFIGGEILKTVVVRTYEEFILLVLVIISRGLLSLILFLERRWHVEGESE